MHSSLMVQGRGIRLLLLINSYLLAKFLTSQVTSFRNLTHVMLCYVFWLLKELEFYVTKEDEISVSSFLLTTMSKVINI